MKEKKKRKNNLIKIMFTLVDATEAEAILIVCSQNFYDLKMALFNDILLFSRWIIAITTIFHTYFIYIIIHLMTPMNIEHISFMKYFIVNYYIFLPVLKKINTE